MNTSSLLLFFLVGTNSEGTVSTPAVKQESAGRASKRERDPFKGLVWPTGIMHLTLVTYIYVNS